MAKKAAVQRANSQVVIQRNMSNEPRHADEITRKLVGLRVKAGIPQVRVGKSIARCQQGISKIERQPDFEWKIGDLVDYLSVLDLDLEVKIVKRN